MATLSCADRWPEGSLELERALVAAAAQTEERDRRGGPPSGAPPGGGGALSLDDSLTSLQWLQDFSILDATAPQRPHQAHLFGRRSQGADAPASPLAGDPASMGGPLTPGKPTAAAYSRLQACGGARGHCYGEVDYRTNAHVKPPYSYATLICMAMQASSKSKITLACIYKWITDNFCYYRHADPTWQNSIRHNLSLNKCFIKVPRQKDEPGKGGFWRIDPQYAERLLSGSYKKRRMPPLRLGPAAPQNPPPPRGPAGDLGGLRVTPESQQLLQEFEELTGPGQTWDPRLTQVAMLGSWPVVRGRGRHRKKQPPGFRGGPVKALRRSSSPLISADDQKEMGPLKGHFDWDGLLDLTLSGELALDGGEPPHTPPSDSPVGIVDIHVSVKTEGVNEESDLGEETFLSASFLETSWPEDDDHSRGDFLCSPSVNLDQLFDLGDSLGGDPSGRIDVLL